MVEKAKKTKNGGKLQLVRSTFFVIVIALALTLPVHGAEKFPTKTIRIINTHVAGSSGDIEFRTVQPSLQKYLGVPVVIEYMPGTAGRKAREYVYDEKPDGYTLLITGMPSCQTGEILFKGRYDTLAFTYIYSLFSEASILLVKSDSPYKDMADFLEKHRGKTLSCGTSGVGSTGQLNWLTFNRHLGLTTRWVPYEGGGEAVTALAGGHIDYAVCDIGSALAMMSAKTVRPLMVFDEKRDPRYPDLLVPKDLGYSVIFIPSLRGYLGPPGVPPDVANILESAFSKAAQDKEFLALAAKANVKVTARDSKEFCAISKNMWNEIKREEEKMKSMIKPQK